MTDLRYRVLPGSRAGWCGQPSLEDPRKSACGNPSYPVRPGQGPSNFGAHGCWDTTVFYILEHRDPDGDASVADDPPDAALVLTVGLGDFPNGRARPGGGRSLELHMEALPVLAGSSSCGWLGGKPCVTPVVRFEQAEKLYSEGSTEGGLEAALRRVWPALLKRAQDAYAETVASYCPHCGRFTKSW